MSTNIRPVDVGCVAWSADPSYLRWNTSPLTGTTGTHFTRFWSFDGGAVNQSTWWLGAVQNLAQTLVFSIYTEDGSQLVTQTGNRNVDRSPTGVKTSPFLTPGILDPDKWYWYGFTGFSMAVTAIGSSSSPTATWVPPDFLGGRAAILSTLGPDASLTMPSSFNPADLALPGGHRGIVVILS
jgi:hypothetical protein